MVLVVLFVAAFAWLNPFAYLSRSSSFCIFPFRRRNSSTVKLVCVLFIASLAIAFLIASGGVLAMSRGGPRDGPVPRLEFMYKAKMVLWR